MAENFIVSEYQWMKGHLLEDFQRGIKEVKADW